MRKKLLSFLLSFSLTLGLFGVNSASAEVGDVIDTALNTDIVAYINHYAIPSYAVNGQSVIVAEDLRNFGFEVTWDETNRSLYITRNSGINEVYQMSVDKDYKTGSKFTDILSTDIKVFAGGTQITSYAMNGYTMIPFEELGMFGDIYWIPEERAIKLWVDDVNVRIAAQPVFTTLYYPNGSTTKVINCEIEAALATGMLYYPDYIEYRISLINQIADQKAADGGYEAGIEYLEGLSVSDFNGDFYSYSNYFEVVITRKIRELCNRWSEEINSPIGIITTKVSKSYGIKEAGIAIRNLTGKELTRFDMRFYCYDPYGRAVKYYGFSNNTNSFDAWCDERFEPYEMKWIYWDLYGFDECSQIKNLTMKSAVFSDGTTWYR